MARRKAGAGGGGGGGHDTGGSGRWMVSYMDMVTVLMCLFIVLFAMSSVDQAKYQDLRHSLQEGFGNIEDAAVVEAAIDNPADEGELPETTDLEMAIEEVRRLTELQDKMEQDLQQSGLADKVRFEVDERGLTVRLVSADTFFSSGSADLTGEARAIMDTVGPVLVPSPYEVAVEGHADYRATTGTIYPTNWELSSARATAVLRHLVDTSGLAAERIAATGFGSARPIAEGKSREALAANRRVDIMALSGKPEAVRAMIPDVLAGSTEHLVEEGPGAQAGVAGATPEARENAEAAQKAEAAER